MIGIDTDTLTLVLDGIALEMIGKVWICLVMMSTDNNYHNNMLDKSLVNCVCNNQLVLDGNIDIYENNYILNEWINSIEKFIYN